MFLRLLKPLVEATIVLQTIKREGPYKHGGGYPEKLNERAKRQIIRALTVRDPPSLSKLISELKLEVSKETVRKFIQNDGVTSG